MCVVIWSFGDSCHQCVDDVASAVDAVPFLEHFLDTMLGWTRDSRLRLNLEKTEVLWMGASSGVCGLGASLSFGEATLSIKDEVCTLGIPLDPVLSMKSQVLSVVCSTFFHLRWIVQLHLYLNTGSLTTLFHALIVSRLDYCNALYVGLPMRVLWKLHQFRSRIWQPDY